MPDASSTSLPASQTSSRVKTVIVMPCYNVAKILPKTIAALPEGDAHEIIIMPTESGRISATNTATSSALL